MGNALTANVVGESRAKTLTLTADTKYIIITGTTADKVIEGTADDIIYDSNSLANTSLVVMSRAGTNNDTPEYYQAAYVYIVR